MTIQKLKKHEKKVKHNETRKHRSLIVLMKNGFDFFAENTETFDILDKKCFLDNKKRSETSYILNETVTLLNENGIINTNTDLISVSNVKLKKKSILLLFLKK